jgi:hypothetical protein
MNLSVLRQPCRGVGNQRFRTRPAHLRHGCGIDPDQTPLSSLMRVLGRVLAAPWNLQPILS